MSEMPAGPPPQWPQQEELPQGQQPGAPVPLCGVCNTPIVEVAPGLAPHPKHAGMLRPDGQPAALCLTVVNHQPIPLGIAYGDEAVTLLLWADGAVTWQKAKVAGGYAEARGRL